MTAPEWQKHFDTNRAKWNAYVPINAASQFYDLDSFKRGKCSLFHVEQEEVGDVSGKKLLHLQCHFGMDTLSWARLGAEVVGVDFAEQGIDLARRLADDLQIRARFVCCNIYDLAEHLDEQFDIVYTSSGVVDWLPDVLEWAAIAARFVKPGGFFYMHELHPAALARAGDDYFSCGCPILYENKGTYADIGAPIVTQGVEWPHSIGDIVTALIKAGLRLEYLHEWPHCVCPLFPDMRKGPDGAWYDGERPNRFPLMYSLRGCKD